MVTLVTGATGLVGNNTVRALLSRGEAVRVLVRKTSDPRPLDSLDVHTVQGDIRSFEDVSRACHSVDRVIHSAAMVQIGWSGLDVQRAVNVGGTRNVAIAAKANGARLIHVSTVDALGVGTASRPADEDSPCEGKTPCAYVVTKREAEQEVWNQIRQGLDAVIVNPGFMLGPWDWKPSSGRMLLQIARRFTPVAPRGGCSVCDVRDVTEGILAAMESGRSGRRYILAGHNMTYFELWKRFKAVTGGRGPWATAGPTAPAVLGLLGDFWGRLTGHEPDVNSAAVAMANQFHYYRSDRAESELGYRHRPVAETIGDAWQWFTQHGYV